MGPNALLIGCRARLRRILFWPLPRKRATGSLFQRSKTRLNRWSTLLAMLRWDCGWRRRSARAVTLWITIAWVRLGRPHRFLPCAHLPDWPQRMSGFYLLNPHPAFTVVQDVTDPFDPNRPPPIVPIKVTLDQIDALLAYMQGLQPADLGAPIKHQ